MKPGETTLPRPLLFAILALALAGGAVFIHLIHRLNPPNWHVYGPDVFYVLMGHYEPVGLGLIAGGALLFVICRLIGRGAAWTPRLSLVHVVILSFAVLLFCYWGTRAVYHRYPYSMDENCAFFQAAIFKDGHIEGEVPEALQPLGRSVLPESILVEPGHHFIQAYLPVYSTLLAATWKVFGDPWLLNPLLSAASVLLLYGTARHLAAGPAFEAYAVIFLVTSAQFLLNGLSAYAMEANLFLNLAWLFFYTHPDRRLYLLCPLIGVLSIGAHEIVCHVLFVLPFLLRLLLDRRWLAAAWSTLVYLVGGLFWVHWLLSVRPTVGGDASPFFALPGSQAGFIFLLSMLVLVSWQNVLMTLGFVAALGHIRTMPAFFRDLLLSAAITLVFYLFFVRSQGAGWGYRYLHPVFANLVLLAAWGATRYSISRLSFAATAVFALALQLPYRCLEVKHVVGHSAQVYAALTRIDANYVIIDRNGGWAVQDFVRNRPDYTNRPLLLFRGPLTDDQFRDLMDSQRAVYLSSPELARLGIPQLKK
jgi:hypothetical protein